MDLYSKAFFESASVTVAADALAAAGALAALRGPGFATDLSRDVAARSIAEARRRADGVRWVFPDIGATAAAGLDAALLASVWRTAAAEPDWKGPARLLLEPRGGAWAPTERAALSWAVDLLYAPLRQFGWFSTWTDLPPDLVAAIAIAARRRDADWRWSWPIRLAARGSVELFFSFAVRRGLVVYSADSSEADLIIGVAHDPVPVRHPAGLAITLLAGRTLDPDLSGLLAETAGDRATSAAFRIKDTDGALDRFVTTIVYELAHNAPLDVAVAVAWIKAGRIGRPPVLFADPHSHFSAMEGARRNPRVFGFDYEENLVLRRREGDILVAGNLASDIGGEPRAGAAETPLAPPAEIDRFLDVGLLKGHHYDDVADRVGARVGAREPLAANADYTLEVAIRARPEGVAQVEPQAVAPPRQDRETVRVYVSVTVIATAAPTVEVGLVPLDWPFDEDTEPAFFRMRTGPAAPAVPFAFEIRLLTADLQLLDHVELTFAAGTESPDVTTWSLVRATAMPPIIAVPEVVSEDSLVFKVSRAGDFVVTAVLRRKGGEPLEVAFSRQILEGDLRQLLTDVRDEYTRLVIGSMASRERLSKDGFDDAVARLGKLGRRAWRELFGDRRGADRTASEALGAILRDDPLPPDSAIRVSLSLNAETFVFPWALVSDPAPGDKDVGFWGIAYEIEIARPRGRARHAAATPVRVAATIDPGFAAVVDHSATLASFARAKGKRCALTLENADTANAIFDSLGAKAPADLYYYFCHGITARSGTSLDATAVKVLRQSVDAIADVGARSAWELFLDRIANSGGGASMFTGTAEISEHQLRDVEFFRGATKPVVFLNMCHSADLLPGLSSGLPRLFLDRDAAAVIGTEAPVTAQFADAFAREMLASLLSGERLGRALLATRRHFHADRNPLVLLYTIYGSANTTIAPSP